MRWIYPTETYLLVLPSSLSTFRPTLVYKTYLYTRKCYLHKAYLFNVLLLISNLPSSSSSLAREMESELRYVTDNKYMRVSEGKEITGVWPVVENGRLGDCIVVKRQL